MFTIGHSTTPIDIFLKVLKDNGITTLADIRSIPKSRFNPQFHQMNLPASLDEAGIKYGWFKDLGGRRNKTKEPKVDNFGWKNASFRNFADYMQEDCFKSALDDFLASMDLEHTAIMCAESVPWRCHRSLVADAMVARDINVLDIIYTATGTSKTVEHKMTKFAKQSGTEVWYPAFSLLAH